MGGIHQIVGDGLTTSWKGKLSDHEAVWADELMTSHLLCPVITLYNTVYHPSELYYLRLSDLP